MHSHRTPNCDAEVSRILLVDDHRLFLRGLIPLVEGINGLEVAGLCHDGLEASRQALEKKPDLILMDVLMPKLNGIEATRRIAAERGPSRILCLSASADERRVTAALEAGAAGYLLKSGDLDELERAVRTVLRGQIFLSPEVAGGVVAAMRRGAFPNSSSLGLLSSREREVLQLLSEGYPARRIADLLHVSPKTVHTHRQQVMRKLRIGSLAGLVKYAILEGLTTAEPEAPLTA